MKRYWAIFFLFSAVFVACNSNVLFDKSEKVNDKGWNMNEKIAFELDVNDTITTYDFAINLRHTTDYPYSNIVFFITTIYPDYSVTKRDTIECTLSNPDGLWKGKGNSKMKDNRFWFARSVKFSQQGRYTFEIEQATRDSNLVGVSDIGLHIENRTAK